MTFKKSGKIQIINHRTSIKKLLESNILTWRPPRPPPPHAYPWQDKWRIIGLENLVSQAAKLHCFRVWMEFEIYYVAKRHNEIQILPVAWRPNSRPPVMDHRHHAGGRLLVESYTNKLLHWFWILDLYWPTVIIKILKMHCGQFSWHVISLFEATMGANDDFNLDGLTHSVQRAILSPQQRMF